MLAVGPMENREIGKQLKTKSKRGLKRTLSPTHTSRFRGVSWFKANNAWKAQITFQGTYEYLGYYKKEEEAAWAYDLRATQLHGVTAQLNFPERQDELLDLSIKAGQTPAHLYFTGGLASSTAKKQRTGSLFQNKNTPESSSSPREKLGLDHEKEEPGLIQDFDRKSVAFTPPYSHSLMVSKFINALSQTKTEGNRQLLCSSDSQGSAMSPSLTSVAQVQKSLLLFQEQLHRQAELQEFLKNGVAGLKQNMSRASDDQKASGASLSSCTEAAKGEEKQGGRNMSPGPSFGMQQNLDLGLGLDFDLGRNLPLLGALSPLCAAESPVSPQRINAAQFRMGPGPYFGTLESSTSNSSNKEEHFIKPEQAEKEGPSASILENRRHNIELAKSVLKLMRKHSISTNYVSSTLAIAETQLVAWLSGNNNDFNKAHEVKQFLQAIDSSLRESKELQLRQLLASIVSRLRITPQHIQLNTSVSPMHLALLLNTKVSLLHFDQLKVSCARLTKYLWARLTLSKANELGMCLLQAATEAGLSPLDAPSS
mmetsp:Transcript_13490/g.24013  ORF Transcript_13490/g.24013 Transcript_13490/m.24013 type:complete len:539 (-) Transcript_13490:195-1811(-)